MKRRLIVILGLSFCSVLSACSGSGHVEHRPGETVVDFTIDGEPVSDVEVPEDSGADAPNPNRF